MKRRPRNAGGGDTSGQLQIEWNSLGTKGPAAPIQHDLITATPAQSLPWDFKSTFPQPTPEALDAGVVSDEDMTAEGIKAMHEQHARELLTALRDLDTVLDARRRGVDPASGRAPTTPAGALRLKNLFATEPARLERWWRTLIETYESAFGTDAADAFGKAVRAWHAGINVIEATRPAETELRADDAATPITIAPIRRTRPHRVIARLPVPRPLPEAVAAARFGVEEGGKAVRPGAHEVREITEQHAEKLIDILDSLSSAPTSGKQRLLGSFHASIEAYAEDFGAPAAAQLEAYVRRQAGLDAGSRRGR